MLTIESKTGSVKGSQKAVYQYVSDFRNFAHLLPKERLQDLELSGNTIRFGLEGFGTIGLEITGEIPSSQITIRATEDSPADFTFVINISETGENISTVKLILLAKLNLFLEMMAKGPLQQFVDLVVNKLSEVEFRK